MTPFLNTEGFNLVFSNKLLKGLVIETYGAGNLKTDKSIFEEIKGAA
jgi:L-asparaginase/Glu-tRNA(Gln) amidotransferase subunit D